MSVTTPARRQSLARSTAMSTWASAKLHHSQFPAHPAVGPLPRHVGGGVHVEGGGGHGGGGEPPRNRAAAHEELGQALSAPPRHVEIGRASCRERVEISV